MLSTESSSSGGTLDCGHRIDKQVFGFIATMTYYTIGSIPSVLTVDFEYAGVAT